MYILSDFGIEYNLENEIKDFYKNYLEGKIKTRIFLKVINELFFHNESLIEEELKFKINLDLFKDGIVLKNIDFNTQYLFNDL